MKKWISLDVSLELAKSSFLRFPLVLLSSALATFLSIYLIDNEQDAEWAGQIIQTALLGLPLFLALSLYLERATMSKSKEWGILGAVLGLLLVYYYTLSYPPTIYEYIRFTLWNIGFHLCVSFMPYLWKREINGFWQFNQALFLRILTAVLYSMVLYIGITIALVAVDQLFGVNIEYTIYLKLWILIVGIFNTWFFLSGIPKDFDALERDEFYPSGLRVFTQFVLLPLVSIYFLILYVYGAKILFTWNLPQGWVTYLVLAFSIAGIFSLLLVHPIQHLEGYRWIRVYVRVFYLALFPLLILLFVSIGRRIYDYGVTEPRYLVVVLALWLTGFSIYFLLSKVKNIQYIPLSLAAVLLLSSFGPWGAFSVSERSQLGRLESILSQNKLLKQGKINTQSKEKMRIPEKDWNEITSIIDFLGERNQLHSLQPYLSIRLDTLLNPGLETYEKTEKMIAFFNDTFENTGWQESETNFTYVLENIQTSVLDVKAYDYVIGFQMYNEEKIDFKLDKQGYIIENNLQKNILSLKTATSSESIVSFDLNQSINNLIKAHGKGYSQVSQAEMSLIEQSQNYLAKLEIQELDIVQKGGGKRQCNRVVGKLFIKLE